MTPSAQDRRARLAVMALFLLIGFALASWVSNIPTIQAGADVSHATLGSALLVLGVGQVSGMQVAGWLSQRYGSRAVCRVGAGALALSVNLPGFATSWWQLAAALLLFGACYGLTNIAANDQAVLVEQRYGRPIMASFHAMFSIGGAVGAGVTAMFQAVGAAVHWPLAVAGILTIALSAWALPRLRDAEQTRKDDGGGAPAPAEPTTAAVTGDEDRAGALRRAFVLGGLAFLLMLSEGTAYDWSTLHAVEHMGRSESVAAFAYAAFSIAMTAGRLGVDRVAARMGPVFVVRAGSAVAVAGLVGVVLAPAYPLTLAGWFVFGLGLSGIVPQIFSAAGNLPVARRSIVLSRVVGAGFVGLLAGPALIGWTSELVGLNSALLLPALLCLSGVLLAGVVAKGPEAQGR